MRGSAWTASVAVAAAVMAVSMTSSAMADDDNWTVETHGNSAGLAHVHKRVINPDPAPAAGIGEHSAAEAPADGEASGGQAESSMAAAYRHCQTLSSAVARGACTGVVIGLAFGARSAPEEAAAAADPAGAAAPPVVMTSSEVAKVMASGSGIVRQPPGSKALVSKIVIAYTSGDSQTLTTTMGGDVVTIVATPVSYTWDWGDGTTLTTKDPGAAYPDHTVFHAYSRTAEGVVITLTTTWTATYSVGGGPAQPVPGTLTTTDTSDPFDLVRRISYLTDDAEEAQGH